MASLLAATKSKGSKSKHHSAEQYARKTGRKPKKQFSKDNQEKSVASFSLKVSRLRGSKKKQTSVASTRATKNQKKDSNSHSCAEKLSTAEEEAPNHSPYTSPNVSTTTTGTPASVLSTVSMEKVNESATNIHRGRQSKEMGSIRKKVVTGSHQVANASNEPPSNKNLDRWAGETAARNWMEKADYSTARKEFEKIQAIPVNVEKDCKKWSANAKWNQSADYPALDSNLVKFENEYVNMSYVDVPLNRGVFVGQFPVRNSEESFWKVIFNKRSTNIHIMAGDESIDFFPLKAEEYKNYGQMWVNNRRVDIVNEHVHRFWIEVLPNGCSNSIICNVTVIKNWKMGSVHPKHSVVIKETIVLTNFLAQPTTPDAPETALVMSKHGAGRAGYFLAFTVIINKMDSKTTSPCIFDIVKAIRYQRPKTVDTLSQYASLYISLFYFIKKKTSKNRDGDSRSSTNLKDPLYKKAVELTNSFVKALMADTSPGSKQISA